MTCPTPQRGVWGGPNQSRQIAAEAATNLAFAPRGNVDLASMLASGVPGATKLDSKGERLPSPPRQPHGCGCNTGGGAAPAGALITLALVLRRRRRRV